MATSEKSLEQFISTFTAPTNIAVIKYWGKDNVQLNTPLNSSVSVTLSQDDLRTTTSIAASKEFKKDRLWLNGKEEDIEKNKRIGVVLSEMRKLAQDRIDKNGKVLIEKSEWRKYHFHIVSVNNFPTAAGLASSAAGYACLVATLADLLCAKEDFEGQFSTIARQGSGSACRSLQGGFVRWHKGSAKDGSDSKAIQIANEDHWPTLHAIICVVNDEKKDTSSTDGMSNSKNTSDFLRFRASEVVPGRLLAIEDAYRKRDFESFGKLTMIDSNQFHATCLDTYPPIFYMNDTSRSIIHLVHQYNKHYGKIKAAYTFDAGPNAVIYTEKENVKELLALLLQFYLPTNQCMISNDSFVLGQSTLQEIQSTPVNSDIRAMIKLQPSRGKVKKIYHTSVGKGVQKKSVNEAILDITTGLPLPSSHSECGSCKTLVLAGSLISVALIGLMIFNRSK